jgi:hypothetical protein
MSSPHRWEQMSSAQVQDLRLASNSLSIATNCKAADATQILFGWGWHRKTTYYRVLAGPKKHPATFSFFIFYLFYSRN